MADEERIDWDKLEEVALALLGMTLHEDGRAWKNIDWGVMDRLHQREWILDPKNKNKSVVLTEEGEKLAGDFFRKHFVS